MLLIGPAMSEGHVRAVINLTQTTSASYLLLASLDISRRNLALRGQRDHARASLTLAEYARRGDQRHRRLRCVLHKSASTERCVFRLRHHEARPSTRSGSAWPGSKSMICCATNTASRSSSATSATFWPMCPIGDREREIERLVSAHRPICAAASGAPVRARYADTGIHSAARSCLSRRRTRSTAGRSVCRWSNDRGPRLRRVRHVLSARHPHPCAGRAHHAADVLDYITYAKAKGCNHDRPGGPAHRIAARAVHLRAEVRRIRSSGFRSVQTPYVKLSIQRRAAAVQRRRANSSGSTCSSRGSSAAS